VTLKLQKIKQKLIDSNLFDSVEYNTTAVRALIFPYDVPISDSCKLQAYRHSWNIMFNDSDCWYAYGDFDFKAKEFATPEAAAEYVIKDAYKVKMDEAIG